jgi:uncharacterized protein (DUF1330 family)
MKHYSMLTVTPTDDSWIPNYLSQVTAIVHQYGGHYLARTAQHERLEGEGEAPGVCVIIEWPNRNAALDFMQDASYAPLLKARSQGSISHHHLVAAMDDVTQ